jgi:hypothetical protein
MEMRHESVLREVNEQKSKKYERCCGCAMLLDRFWCEIQNRNRQHEAG